VPAAVFRGILLGVLAGLATGCSFTVGRLALVTTREVEPHAASVDPRHVTIESCVPLLFVFPVGPLPNIGRAVSAALEAGHGSALRNVVVRYEMLYVPFVFGHGCYVVEGDLS
jgi:hypothetical protein